MEPLGEAEFADLMRPLGPWGGLGTVAVAVSGGADSLCLAWLAGRWAASRGAAVTGLIVDHGLRDGSADEAALAASRLRGIGLQATILAARNLLRGPGLAARARTARYELLTQACLAGGIVDLLVAHHAGDQAETALMRQRAGSGEDGLAAMARLVETRDLRLLRPLLGVSPGRLRATLRAAGLDWSEDPSNQDLTALRTRLRRELDAEPAERARRLEGLATRGEARVIRQRDRARDLAGTVELRPEGYALLPAGPVPAALLGALIRVVAGAQHQASSRAIAALAGSPRAATLGGARLLSAGRLAPGWLLVREAAAVQGPVPAADGVVWDGRYRLHAPAIALPPGACIAAGAGRGNPRRTGLPAAVLSSMPRLVDRTGATIALPAGARFAFEPAQAASAAACFGSTSTL